jgi:hypothetical protein
MTYQVFFLLQFFNSRRIIQINLLFNKRIELNCYHVLILACLKKPSHLFLVFLCLNAIDNRQIKRFSVERLFVKRLNIKIKKTNFFLIKCFRFSLIEFQQNNKCYIKYGSMKKLTLILKSLGSFCTYMIISMFDNHKRAKFNISMHSAS